MEQLKITPNILHKESADDVLIREADLVLPAMLSFETMQELRDHSTPNELASILAAYRDCGYFYVVRGVPARIPVHRANTIDGFEADIAAFYSLNNDHWVLTAEVIPNSLVPVITHLGDSPAEPPFSTAQKEAIVRILATRPKRKIAPIHSYKAHNDTANYFFYRKVHEHVPGLMLIEIARQVIYHYVYCRSGYRRGDVSISISDLHAKFVNYVESAYDLEVLVTQTDGLARHTPRFIDKTVSFYQNGRLVTSVKLIGAAMGLPLFKRLRTLGIPATHWFVLSSRVIQQALLTDRNGAVHPVQVEQLSMAGVRLARTPDETRNYCTLSLHVKDHGFVVLPLAEQNQEISEKRIEFHFATMNAAQKYTLQEVIKCHCFFSQKMREAHNGRSMIAAQDITKSTALAEPMP